MASSFSFQWDLTDLNQSFSTNNRKRIDKNQNIVQTVLNTEIAKKWSTNQHNPYKLVTIPCGSTEFNKIASAVLSTYRGCRVSKIQRIENPFLLGHYLLKKEKLQERYGHVEDGYFFHGTNLSNVDKICSNNFDWRLKGTSRGHKFGQGVSFSPSAFYAHHYGNVLLFVRILKRQATIGNVFTTIPPEPYDTTTNGKGTVYVKYEDDDYYPEYVIHYEKPEFDFFEELYEF